MFVLGLDVSTSITGATVLDSSGNVLKSEFWDTRNKNKFKSLYEKGASIRDRLLQINKNFKITEVFIEQSLQSFRSGFSSAKTLSTLSRFNGIISWMCFDIFEVNPQMIAASSARKKAGLKIKRGENAKEKVLNFVVDKYPEVRIEYTKHGNPKPGTYDLCDSLIIAKAGLSIVRESGNT